MAGHAADGTFVIALVNCSVANTWQVVAKLPKSGNGLGVHFQTGLLYASTEGNFLPSTGEVFEVSQPAPCNCVMNTFASNVTNASDAHVCTDKLWL